MKRTRSGSHARRRGTVSGRAQSVCEQSGVNLWAVGRTTADIERNLNSQNLMIEIDVYATGQLPDIALCEEM